MSEYVKHCEEQDTVVNLLKTLIVIIGFSISLYFSISIGVGWGNNILADIVCSVFLFVVFFWLFLFINSFLYEYSKILKERYK